MPWHQYRIEFFDPNGTPKVEYHHTHEQAEERARVLRENNADDVRVIENTN